MKLLFFILLLLSTGYCRGQFVRDTTSEGVKLTIEDAPIVSSFDLPSICVGDMLDLAAPAVTGSVLRSGWFLDSVAITMPYQVGAGDVGKYLSYWAENNCTVVPSGEASVSISFSGFLNPGSPWPLPVPSIIPNGWFVCGGHWTFGPSCDVSANAVYVPGTKVLSAQSGWYLGYALDVKHKDGSSRKTLWSNPVLGVLKSPGSLCAGSILGVVAPGVSGATGQGWLLGDTPLADPLNYKVSLSDNGKELKFWAKNACGADTVRMSLVVHSVPVVSFTGDASVCAGDVVELVLQVTRGTAPYAYTLTGGLGSFSNQTGGKTFQVSPSSTTTYGLALLTDNNGCGLSGPPTDSDGNTYPTLVIGSQTWMAKNLNDSKKGGECYDGNSANCATYGRLYTWDEAMAACPVGWHLPSDDEWKTLEMVLGMTQADADGTDNRKSGNVGTKLKEGGSSGMNLLLGGNEWSGSYYYLGSYGYCWTSTEYNSSSAWIRNVSSDHAGVYRGEPDKALRISVRCVKD